MTSRQTLNASLAKGHLRRGDAHAVQHDEGAANAHYDRARSYAQSRSAFGTCAARLSGLLRHERRRNEISVATVRMRYVDDDRLADQAALVSSALGKAGTPDFVAIQDARGDAAIDGYRRESKYLDLAALVPDDSEP